MEENNRTFSRVDMADKAEETVTIHVDGVPLAVPSGITVAAAVLNHGEDHFCRSAAANDKRSPHCLMGVCFECLCEIDGIPNRQACLTRVAEGMRINRQNLPEVSP